jgi:hypothetical protein
MFHVVEIVAVLIVSVVMAMSLAHALEFPGKRRLDRDGYFAAQTIYYPGFSVAGISEPLSILLVFVLLVMTPVARTMWWQVLIALLLLIAMHLVFWLVTQPVNKYWLASEKIGPTGARFFAVEKARGVIKDWTALRDRWEYSHLARAALAGTAFVLLVIAVVP